MSSLPDFVKVTYRDLSENALKGVIANRCGWGIFTNDKGNLSVHDNNGHVWVTPDNATEDNVWERTPLLDIGFAISTVVGRGYKLTLVSPALLENNDRANAVRATVKTRSGHTFTVERKSIMWGSARCIMEAWLMAMDFEGEQE